MRLSIMGCLKKMKQTTNDDSLVARDLSKMLEKSSDIFVVPSKYFYVQRDTEHEEIGTW